MRRAMDKTPDSHSAVKAARRLLRHRSSGTDSVPQSSIADTDIALLRKFLDLKIAVVCYLSIYSSMFMSTIFRAFNFKVQGALQ